MEIILRESSLLDRIPLEAFRVFDAACHHMNFSRAGRDLNITQAAVSRRIKLLEEELGAQLFTRRGKNLALTPAGERLSLRVRSTLEYLEESLEPFRSTESEMVSLAASGSVSHLWLGEHLRRFSRDNPTVNLRLTTTDSPAELASENNDLVILYSVGDHPRWHLSLLFEEDLLPVASPACLGVKMERAPELSPDEIASLGLIDYERFNAHWISFRQWFGRLQNPPANGVPHPRFSFSTYALAINAALAGDGVALGSRALIAHHLESGRLIALGTESLRTGFGYYVGLPVGREVGPAVRALHEALLSTAVK